MSNKRDLTSLVNSHCFKISHSHRKNTDFEKNKKIKSGFTQKDCICCGQRKINIICYNFLKVKYIPLSFESQQIFHIICGRFDSKLYLPIELRLIIIKFAVDRVESNTIDEITNDTLNHMKSCQQCSITFTKILEKYSCPHHILPRF